MKVCRKLTPSNILARLTYTAMFVIDAFVLLAVNGLAQLVNISVGLLIVRSVTVEQYAAYTLGNAVFAIGSVLATMTVPSAAMFLISRPDAGNGAAVIAESVRIIRILSIVAAMISGSVIWFYSQQFADWSALLVALAVASPFFAARSNLWRAIAFARRKVALVARCELSASIARLLLTTCALAVPLGRTKAFVLLAINVIATWITARLLDQRTGDIVRKRDVRRALVRYIVPLIPEHVYFLLQGQVGVLILAAVGNTEAVAELGALSRLSMLLAVLGILNTGVFQPFVARYKSSADFVRRSVVVMVTWCVVGALFMGISCLFPDVLIAIVGAQYTHLAKLVPLMALVSVLTMLGGALYAIVLASGRPTSLALTVPAGLLVQTAYLTSVGITTVERAIGFALCSAVSDVAVRGMVWLREMMSMARVGDREEVSG